MGQVHELLASRGRQAALESGLERGIVETAEAYLSNEEGGTNFLYSGWCQTALPHKRTQDDEIWRVDSGPISLIIQPGIEVIGEQTVPIGVPFGSRARLILLYLQTTALKTGSREIELGKSLRQWLGRMGIKAVGGKAIDGVREQALRIGTCNITFYFTAGQKKGFVRQPIVEAGMFEESDSPRPRFLEAVKLGENFFEQLRKHPVPVEDAAIQAINNNSQALDIYVWLAYRLHSLKEPTPLSWRAAKGQFGQGVAELRKFKQTFKKSLELALAVYPAAKVDLVDDGLRLYPSRPPVASKLIAVGA
ncbi:replication protein RepA [Rhodovastum atsumiense]|uniref:replication protein RepA n=1 Tax=Rhodovastum atsumiense TaxID=504468 RepID=UPI0020251FED|nr:replication protein RepA [Rhodovastum atsumiense]